MNQTLTILAYIDHFLFRNAENGYGVAELVLSENSPVQLSELPDGLVENDRLNAVGILRGCDSGDILEVTGSVVEHPVYGLQLSIEHFRVREPEDAPSVERYLASGAITGIGAKLAHRIVARFGDDTFRIMEEEPERLAELKGISERMAREIGVQMQEKRELRETSMFLQSLGIGGLIGARVIRRYGERTVEIIRENPYRLADEIDGVGFKTADEIAQHMGIRVDAEFRVSGGILYALQQAGGDGHCYLPAGLLKERALRLLGLPVSPETESLLESRIRALNVERRIVVNGDAVYDARTFREEQAVAAMLRAINVHWDDPVREGEMEEVERTLSINLDEGQRSAVRMSLSEGVMILTGGPGTGKTTTLAAILKLLERHGRSFLLAAPTGRAAKRMTETTGYEARTIHRLLEISGGIKQAQDSGDTDRRVFFNRNEENPLEAEYIIIDEMSMVDLHLFCSLLKACIPGMHLILIGDAAQLPSVGPGQVLRDLIDSGRYPVARLTQIFRQAAQSDIVMNAHRILAGEMPVMDNDSKDFFFMQRSGADVITDLLALLIREKMPKYVKAPAEEIQVLVPMRRGPLGAETLNRALQKVLNPPSPRKKEWHQGDQIWRVGDKVMQTKNDYNAVWEIRGRGGIVIDHGEGIFNGDLGTILAIDEHAREITVMFDEQRQVRVPFTGMEDMDLAYAMTIHKSQGSEYPAVLLPLLGGPRMLLSRNLLYTAVTRAKSCVVILGSRTTVEEMVENVDEMKRYTGLVDRIRELSA